MAGQAPRSPQDARYFIAWIDHLSQATAAYPDWNSPAEKSIGAGDAEVRPQGLRETAVAAGGVVRASKNNHSRRRP